MFNSYISQDRKKVKSKEFWYLHYYEKHQIWSINTQLKILFCDVKKQASLMKNIYQPYTYQPYVKGLCILDKTGGVKYIESFNTNKCSLSTGEHPCWSVISIKLLCSFIEITLRHGCFPVNLLHLFRNFC